MKENNDCLWAKASQVLAVIMRSVMFLNFQKSVIVTGQMGETVNGKDLALISPHYTFFCKSSSLPEGIASSPSAELTDPWQRTNLYKVSQSLILRLWSLARRKNPVHVLHHPLSTDKILKSSEMLFFATHQIFKKSFYLEQCICNC